MTMPTTPAAEARQTRLTAAVCCVSALVSLGFSVAAVLVDGPAQTNAGYALTRSIAIAVTALLVLAWRSRTATVALAVAVTVMQAGDAVVGLAIHDVVKTAGPAFLAIVTGWLGWRLWSAARRA